jgi:hypothetical protein
MQMQVREIMYVPSGVLRRAPIQQASLCDLIPPVSPAFRCTGERNPRCRPAAVEALARWPDRRQYTLNMHLSYANVISYVIFRVAQLPHLEPVHGIGDDSPKARAKGFPWLNPTATRACAAYFLLS